MTGTRQAVQIKRRRTDQDGGNISVTAIPLGLVAGVVVGMFLDNLALGLAIGLCAGGAVSALGSARRRQGSGGGRK